MEGKKKCVQVEWRFSTLIARSNQLEMLGSSQIRLPGVRFVFKRFPSNSNMQVGLTHFPRNILFPPIVIKNTSDEVLKKKIELYLDLPM